MEYTKLLYEAYGYNLSEKQLTEADIDVQRAIRHLKVNATDMEAWRRAIRVARRNGKVLYVTTRYNPHFLYIRAVSLHRLNSFIYYRTTYWGQVESFITLPSLLRADIHSIESRDAQ